MRSLADVMHREVHDPFGSRSLRFAESNESLLQLCCCHPIEQEDSVTLYECALESARILQVTDDRAGCHSLVIGDSRWHVVRNSQSAILPYRFRNVAKISFLHLREYGVGKISFAEVADNRYNELALVFGACGDL